MIRKLFLAAALAAVLAPAAALAATHGQAHASAAPTIDPERLALAQQLITETDLAAQLRQAFIDKMALPIDDKDPNSARRAQAFAGAVEDVGPELNARAARAYAETFTAAELRDLVAFGATPEGHGVLAKTPEAMKLMAAGKEPPQPAPERLALARDMVEAMDIRSTIFSPFGEGAAPGSPLAKQLEKMLPQVEAKCAVLFAALFTDEELKAGARFMRTPSGRAYDRKTNSELQLHMMPVMLGMMSTITDKAEVRYCAAGPCTDKDHKDFQAMRDLLAMLGRMPTAQAGQVVHRAMQHQKP
jgi:hypothetical protein